LSSRKDSAQKPLETIAVGIGQKWQKFVDPESGHPYYYNENTEESTYERPLDYRTSADPFSAVKEKGVMPPAEVLASARSSTQKPVEKLPQKWFKYIDNSSEFPYYYNSETEESTYERPDGFSTTADPFASARDQGVMPPAEVLASARSSLQKPDEKVNGGPWYKYTDPESGHPYYYNSETEESTYDRPEGFQVRTVSRYKHRNTHSNEPTTTTTDHGGPLCVDEKIVSRSPPFCVDCLVEKTRECSRNSA
jgi:hypothetical protein